ncbi:hypothetical protein KUTeg_023270 [Tegillarca granosa]|uniref:Low-density lipoprotein receptor-related protein 6 n=1 Tax=Tegillarca granosa TaxID=220873 RepID=A0ABQ9E257_TEGGR|nr:hypothetical protein KUTeg_023270 [Tegillarca granosa]
MLLANRRNVQLLDASEPDADVKAVFSDFTDAVNADFLYDKQQIFVSDQYIYRIGLNQSRDNNLIVTELYSWKSLACDWITEKLYSLDLDFKRVEVFTIDGKYRKILLWDNLDKPRSIALDPIQGRETLNFKRMKSFRWMFWTDWGSAPKIERCGMDGNLQSRSAIVKYNIQWPNSVTMDYEHSTIYWTDAGIHRIERCNYDGSNRRSIVNTDLLHPFGITLFNESLYWTDWRTRSIYRCNKDSGNNREIVASNKYSPMDIRVMSQERQPRDVNITCPCDVNNGGCSHLCLISPIKPFYTCACPTGVNILEDQKTCAEGTFLCDIRVFIKSVDEESPMNQALDEFIIFSRKQDLRVISLDTTEGLDINLPIKDHQLIGHIAYDSVDRHIYWADTDIPAIRRSHLDGTGVEDVITDLLFPESISIDWIAGNLYFVDSMMYTIDVSRLNGSSRKMLVTENLDEPRSVCVDPVNGYMFWTDWGGQPRIVRANMDGTDQFEIITSSLTRPYGIAVDSVEKKVYWGDTAEYKIEEANYDGSNRRLIFSGDLVEGSNERIFGFSLLGDNIYWTDLQKEAIERVNIKSGSNETVFSGRKDLVSVVAVKRYGLEDDILVGFIT